MQRMEGSEVRPRMISPAPGFTARVMARIEERQRAEAQRRAWIGVGLLVIAAAIPLAALVAWLLQLLSGLYIIPDVAVQLLVTLLPYALALGEFGLALLSLQGIQLLGYALFVLGLTFVWAHIVAGSSQRQLT